MLKWHVVSVTYLLIAFMALSECSDPEAESQMYNSLNSLVSKVIFFSFVIRINSTTQFDVNKNGTLERITVYLLLFQLNFYKFAYESISVSISQY